ncbi:MAG: bifunctional acetate--CoA ligase family protein/GNAT family N-acetyltransferase [Methylobacillus sp.]|jgi:acetyltransferase|nr:bifunctional acetate--CoA ligase family protein/GNAT family N-acetyltransferase [Methylobacillus sp.]
MAEHYLNTLFSPKSVAVIGASSRIEAVGGIVFKNMLESGFTGALYAVNPSHAEVQGQRAYASIEDIPAPVELAVICTKAATVPDIIDACGHHGTRAVVVLSAGFSEVGSAGAAIERDMLARAKAHGIRIIGPNCLGVMRPASGLNATFFKGNVKPGNLALVSQSGALCTAILDYAPPNDIGFSSVVSMGASTDIDFGEVLDYLANDPQTQSILIYVEGIRKARSFVSALRAAARSKPVFAIKVGRHAAGSKAVQSHTGALVGSDDVFDAALQRAGVVRVSSIGQLFAAAKSLASERRFGGDRLAVITNGGGPGVMAVDRAVDLNVRVANLSAATLEKLNQALPSTWSHNNPIDIIGDAPAERYRDAVTICMEDNDIDGVLVILTPQAMTKPTEAAQALIDIAGKFKKPLLTCWMGAVQVSDARIAFAQARIPTFRTPEAAVEAFSCITAFSRNQRLLTQVPGPLAHREAPDVNGARMLIETALAEERKVLSEMESKALLAAFRIPVASTVVARSPSEALMLAQQLGYPVAMKINSPDITHKSDAGGVRLNLVDAAAVRAAYHEILQTVQKNRPEARLDGIAIQPMVVKPNGRELMLGVTTDPVFGPVITFGAGGIAVEIMKDRAVALPPLNSFLARELISETRVSKLLGAFRHMPAVNMDALESLLLRVSEMTCELPWLKEMDINPLIVDEHGALAADARVMIDYAPSSNDSYAHMAIHPYPAHLVEPWQLADGTNITIRPIRPEDAQMEQDFVRGLSDQAKYFRFMNAMHELSDTMLERFTQIDYDREMALIATVEENSAETQIGVSRYTINPDGESCEFAVVVSDRWQHKAVGRKLMECLMEAARDKGLKTMEGDVLMRNQAMLKLTTTLGFTATPSTEDPALQKVVKVLNRP